MGSLMILLFNFEQVITMCLSNLIFCWLGTRFFPLIDDLLDRSVRPQPAFTCSNITIETLEQGVKYVQSQL